MATINVAATVPLAMSAGQTSLNLGAYLAQSFSGYSFSYFGVYDSAVDTRTGSPPPSTSWGRWQNSTSADAAFTVNGNALATSQFHSFNATTINDVMIRTGPDIGSYLYVSAYATPVDGSQGGTWLQIEIPMVPVVYNDPTPNQVTASDVVAASYALLNGISGTLSPNGCHSIAATIAAMAGAPLPTQSGSIIPSQNQDGGYWKAVIRGAASNGEWLSSLRPGDIVRADYSDPSKSQHTFTVLEVNGTQVRSIDNANTAGAILDHWRDYGSIIDPASVTVYRITETLNTIYGSSSNDALVGSWKADRLIGGLGNDSLYGGGANDELLGGDGNDHLFGQDGDDMLFGGEGGDRLFGWVGNDQLFGDGGDDQLYGQGGDDTLFGWTGNDKLFGDDGADRLFGQEGDDEIFGWSGNDEIYGDDGIDRLFGQGGNDTIFGWNGNDQVFGDDGDDQLFGQGGNDTIFAWSGNDLLIGDDGADQLFGQGGQDRLLGGAGDDLIFGGEDFDIIFAGTGNDTIHGEGAGDQFWFATNDLQSGAFDNVFGADVSDRFVFDDAIANSLNVFNNGANQCVIRVNLASGGYHDVNVFGLTASQVQAQTVYWL